MSWRSKKEPRTMGSPTPLLIAFPKSSSTELNSVNASSSHTKSFDQLRSLLFLDLPLSLGCPRAEWMPLLRQEAAFNHRVWTLSAALPPRTVKEAHPFGS